MRGTKTLNNLNIWHYHSKLPTVHSIPTIVFHVFLSFVSGFRLSLAIVEGQAIIKKMLEKPLGSNAKVAKIHVPPNFKHVFLNNIHLE